MDAAFPRRAPARMAAAGHAAPLLATLGVHLLLALSWRSGLAPAPDLRGERFFELVPVAPPRPETARLRPEPPRPRIATASAPRARAKASPAGAARESAPATPPPEAPSSAADRFAAPPAPGAAQPALDDIVGRARRDAGAIDRALRKGKPGVPETADTPWGRFTSTLEAAHKERGRGVTSETYTAPDGQVIYRFRHGGKYRCRSGGSVGPRIGGAVGGGEVLFDVRGGAGLAGEVSCPGQVQWRRD